MPGERRIKEEKLSLNTRVWVDGQERPGGTFDRARVYTRQGEVRKITFRRLDLDTETYDLPSSEVLIEYHPSYVKRLKAQAHDRPYRDQDIRTDQWKIDSF